MKVLFTGGRAPVTLDLARAFHRAGHQVFMAESFDHHLSRASRAVSASFHVPPPRQDPAGFFSGLADIIHKNKIELLIPTCEEVFTVAQGMAGLPCRVFTRPIDELDLLHNKWEFTCRAAPFDIPSTLLVGSSSDLLLAFAQWKHLVLKPVYSRFAAQTLVKPKLMAAREKVDFRSGRAWLAQEFVEGRAWCTYSVCHAGRITAHASYPSRFTAGQGATIVFEHVDHPALFKRISTFVRNIHFTGQIAFDFIETADGRMVALECNPRATSGAHLLTPDPRFVNAFLDPDQPCITPQPGRSFMLASAMWAYGLPAALRKKEFQPWWAALRSSRDVIFDPSDPLPFFQQFRGLLAYLMLARKEGISPLEASTFDIEWNG